MYENVKYFVYERSHSSQNIYLNFKILPTLILIKISASKRKKMKIQDKNSQNSPCCGNFYF